MKSVEEWLDIWTRRIDKAFDISYADNMWYMQQEKEHPEAIRNEQREACVKAFWESSAFLNLYSCEQNEVETALRNAGKAD